MSQPFLIDAHSHINFSAYKDDADAVIARAEAEGIWQIAVGSQLDTSRRAVEYAERYEHVWTVVGLHPIHLVGADVDFAEVGEEGKEGIAFRTHAEAFDAAAYRALFRRPKVVGIGECGLDFYRLGGGEGGGGSDVEAIRHLQEDAFRQQIALAREFDLPLMVHVRDGATGNNANAHEATIAILRDTYGPWSGTQPRGLIHCYGGTWDQAQRYLALGFNIGFTGVITFRPTKKQFFLAKELVSVVCGVPLNRFHVETDCPYLAPEPHRGTRNEPRYVRHVAEKIAELRGMSLEEVARVTTENTMRLFRGMV